MIGTRLFLKISTRPHVHYGWIIVAACFMTVVGYGPFHAFGVYFKSLQSELEWSRAFTSSIQSAHLLVFAISAIIMGRLTDKYGPRRVIAAGAILTGVGISIASRAQTAGQFYAFYLIASIGSGISWATPIATVQRWFVKRRGLSLGLVSAGGGASILIFAPLSGVLLANYGWRTSYLALGIGTGLLLLLAAYLIFRNPKDKGLEPYGFDNSTGQFREEAGLTQKPTKLALFKSRLFINLATLALLTSMPQSIVSIHLVPAMTDAGINTVAAASALGLIGAFNIAGRIGVPSVADRVGWRRTLIICCFMSAVMYFWLTDIKELSVLYIFVVFYGIFSGGRSSLLPGMIGSVFGMNYLGEVTGYIYGFAFAIGSVGPFLGGWIFDITGSYFIVFLINAFLLVIAGIIAISMKSTSKKQT